MHEKYESESFIPKRESQALLKQLQVSADEFDHGIMLNKKEKVHEGDKSAIYRCIENAAEETGVEGARFRLDYRKYHAPKEGQFDQLRFEYTCANEGNEQHPFAEMHIFIVNDENFILHHRYVSPELRSKKGIGSRLFDLTQTWVQQVAEDKNKTISIIVQTGQENVIKWLEKMGFSIKKECESLLEEVRSHPENFFQDSVILSQESQDTKVVKDPYTFRKGTEGRYMEDAIRLTFEKKFKPKSHSHHDEVR